MSEIFYNISIKATLTTTSPMLLGDGQTGDSYDLKSCIDNQNRFYIPGATLKGSLANLVQRLEDDSEKDELQHLFGQEKQNRIRGSKTFIAGKVRFLDATSTQEISEQIEETITRNSIDPITRTAKEHHLFTQHQIKVGTQFTLELQLERATQVQLEQLLGLLVIWPQQALGRNTNNGQGQFELSDIQTFATKSSELQQWLTESSEALAPTKEVNDLLCNFVQTKDDFVTLALDLVPYSPFFSTDHQDKQRQLANKATEDKLLIRSICQNGIPIILGSSFRGALKAQAKRIFHTLTNSFGDNANQLAEEFLAPIFGDEKQSSKFKVSHFSAQNKRQLEQNFIAVDRFTGAVKNGANYNLQRYEVSSYLGNLEIERSFINQSQYHPQLAILILLLRDLLEGEIKLGAFQAKGFGCIKANIALNQKPITNWQDFCNHWNNSFPDATIPQLEAALQQTNKEVHYD